MKRIIYIHQYFRFPNQSGATRSYDLATALISRGYKVEVITSSSDKRYKTKKRWKTEERSGMILHYIYLPYENTFSFQKRLSVFFKFLWFSTGKLLTVKGNIVLASSTPLTIGIPALIKKWFQKTPYVFEVRDVWPEAVIAIGAIKNRLVQKLLFTLEKILYNNAVAIVPLSIDMKQSILRRYPDLKSKTIPVIENISEINRFQRVSGQRILERTIGFKPRFTVLYAGTFGQVNGIDYVIDLAEIVRELDSTIVFLLIGKGSKKSKIIQAAKEKDLLNKTVFILDAVNKEELPDLYSDVQMGSSFVIDIQELWANSANKFFDTLASGKPILINHEGWQADVIRTENIGYVLPPRIDRSVVRDFVKYTRDEQVHAIQSSRAHQIAIRDYSLEVASNKYHKLFESIS